MKGGKIQRHTLNTARTQVLNDFNNGLHIYSLLVVIFIVEAWTFAGAMSTVRSTLVANNIDNNVLKIISNHRQSARS